MSRRQSAEDAQDDLAIAVIHHWCCEAHAEELAKGGIEPGKYAYVKCPKCGLVQDAANKRCARCGHPLTEARKGMFATYNQKGVKPTLHSKPPPPASKQPDLRKGKP
jgi:DNA-directed RNA polymerase subunit RPC12/RpoP